MKPQIIKDKAYQVDTNYGIEIVPFHVAGPDATKEDLQAYCTGTIHSIQRNPMGFVYRLSMSGYCDCTEWNYATTEPMAIIHLREMYGNDDDEQGGNVQLNHRTSKTR